MNHDQQKQAGHASRVLLAFLSDDPISSDQLSEDIRIPAAGASVSFDGVVRDHDSGRAVAGLRYSAHPSAEAILQWAAKQIADEHPDVSLAVAHRVGALKVGECALACVVWSAHRADAFRACLALVDRVKEIVPIWKEQSFADGAVEWVNSVS